MTGLEIVAAIISICAGVATCGKYAKQIHASLRTKKSLSGLLSQAELLCRSLYSSEHELEDELSRIKRLSRTSSYRYGKKLFNLWPALGRLTTRRFFFTDAISRSTSECRVSSIIVVLGSIPKFILCLRPFSSPIASNAIA
jgi:hypothetical protein